MLRRIQQQSEREYLEHVLVRSVVSETQKQQVPSSLSGAAVGLASSMSPLRGAGGDASLGATAAGGEEGQGMRPEHAPQLSDELDLLLQQQIEAAQRESAEQYWQQQQQQDDQLLRVGDDSDLEVALTMSAVQSSSPSLSQQPTSVGWLAGSEQGGGGDEERMLQLALAESLRPVTLQQQPGSSGSSSSSSSSSTLAVPVSSTAVAGRDIGGVGGIELLDEMDEDLMRAIEESMLQSQD